MIRKRLDLLPENWTGEEDRRPCHDTSIGEVAREEMSTQRNRDSAEFNARVALDAINGHNPVNELRSLYGVHPTQIPPGNLRSNGRCPRFSRPDGLSVNRTRTAAKPGYTDQLGHSKWSWTGGKKAGVIT
jgi:hypothetical protein